MQEKIYPVKSLGIKVYYNVHINAILKKATQFLHSGKVLEMEIATVATAKQYNIRI